jgi:hypothetical protein
MPSDLTRLFTPKAQVEAPDPNAWTRSVLISAQKVSDFRTFWVLDFWIRDGLLSLLLFLVYRVE